MARLNSLYRLSQRICSEKPKASTLHKELEMALTDIPTYSRWSILLTTMCAQICLNLILGGNLKDAACMAFLAAFIFEINTYLYRPGMNRIICNAITMFIASVCAREMVAYGICHNLTLLLVNCCMYLLPGVQMVFAVKNILCGNEINGSVSLLRVFLEMLGIVGGIALAEIIFGGGMLIW